MTEKFIHGVSVLLESLKFSKYCRKSENKSQKKK